MFTKEEKSTFKYWLAHWMAYNLTALNFHAWKFKYLFHDFEKPWLKLFLPYEKVRKLHRKYNKHHFTYRNKNKIDWEALVIDWECSRLTKLDAPLNARETYNYTINERYQRGDISDEMCNLLKKNIPPILEKFNL